MQNTRAGDFFFPHGRFLYVSNSSSFLATLEMTGCFSRFLIRRFELFEETHIVFREHAEVFHLVLQVGDAFYAHAESVA